MLARVEIDRAEVPGGGTLRLMRRGRDHQIMLGSSELMSSRQSGSEAAMATLAAARIDTIAPCVLIGGLGMGFTLRAALAAFGDDARIVVAELVPQVIEWARGPLADLFAGSLDDPRVTLMHADVAAPIKAAREEYAAILLDVDNGPDGLTHPANDALYRPAGLAACARALRPGGILSIWSADASPPFTRRLTSAGFAVEQHPVHAHQGRGRKHMVWLATRA